MLCCLLGSSGSDSPSLFPRALNIPISSFYSHLDQRSFHTVWTLGIACGVEMSLLPSLHCTLIVSHSGSVALGVCIASSVRKIAAVHLHRLGDYMSRATKLLGNVLAPAFLLASSSSSPCHHPSASVCVTAIMSPVVKLNSSGLVA